MANVKNCPDMIHHIVLWRLNGETPEQRAAQARKIKAALEALNGRIPGLLRLDVGRDVSATPNSADVALYSEFDSAEALAAYQTHPEHLRAAAVVAEAARERHLVDFYS